jgi:nucleotide-binding universal stress UspA family protein
MKILLATDGSESAESAAKFLSCLDFSADDEITVFHAVNWVPFLYDRESYYGTLKEIKKEIAPRILDSALEALGPVTAKLSTAMIDGPAEYSIVDTAVKAGMDLIVMGARGIKGIRSIFVGSVTKSVIVNSPKSVLVTKLPVCGRSKKMKILLAADGSEHSVAAGKLLARLPFRGNAALTIMNVIWSDFSDIPERFVLGVNDRIKEVVAEARSEEVRESRRVVEQAKDFLAGKFCDIQTLTQVGDPSTEILKAADTVAADLIVVGSRGLRGMKGMLGSVSRNVLTHSKCSVLIGK